MQYLLYLFCLLLLIPALIYAFFCKVVVNMGSSNTFWRFLWEFFKLSIGLLADPLGEGLWLLSTILLVAVLAVVGMSASIRVWGHAAITAAAIGCVAYGWIRLGLPAEGSTYVFLSPSLIGAGLSAFAAYRIWRG